MKPKPCCQTLRTFLKGNLGPRCLAPLTGTDARALDAAVHILELYSYHRVQDVLAAFKAIVLTMQPHTRHFAYHAIAMVMDWEFRSPIWTAAGLRNYHGDFPRCEHEPKS
jgi:hypothetical protein